mmetsp:Transcript_52553/g.114622  ORF Transcript_52553/g.114622 Transcript_52553/m.114622 type:complete len:209 (+) Transcript_52553:1188-1814(+)
MDELRGDLVTRPVNEYVLLSLACLARSSYFAQRARARALAATALPAATPAASDCWFSSADCRTGVCLGTVSGSQKRVKERVLGLFAAFLLDPADRLDDAVAWCASTASSVHLIRSLDCTIPLEHLISSRKLLADAATSLAAGTAATAAVDATQGSVSGALADFAGPLSVGSMPSCPTARKFCSNFALAAMRIARRFSRATRACPSARR